MRDEASRATGRGLDRLVNFSDAVVAIAITLLILPVVDSAGSATSVGDLIDGDGGRIVAFLLSFLVIAQFWVEHHRLFERVGSYSPALLWLNMAYLLSIVFLPVPTELLGVQGPDDAGVRLLYLATITFTSGSLVLLTCVVHATPRLRARSGPPDFSLAPGLITFGALVVATILGSAIEAIGLRSLLLLVVAAPITSRIDARLSQR